MKCVIGQNTYTAIDSLSFSPETDLTGNSLPINEFEVRLFTNDIIAYGQYAELRDDLNNLWARYWISYAERIGRDVDKETYIVKLIAQSPLAFLERVRIPAKMYNTTADAVFSDILTLAGQTGIIVLDSEVATEWASIGINGFCPEQSARERLLWLTLCAGGYIESFFGSTATVRKVDLTSTTLIPIEKTYWKPTVSHRDYVTKIRIHAYTFTEGSPANTDDYVTDGVTYWIVQNTTITLSNNNIPAGVPENVVEIEDITMISPNNASTIANNLVAYYFDRTEIDCDVIDNYEYKPGDLVTLYTDEDQLYTGYIDSVGFSFGVQAKGTLHLTPCAATEGAMLTVHYKWGDLTIATRVYYLPKDYHFSITTEYLDQRISGHRYIFRPDQFLINGVLTEDRTVTVTCQVALDHYRIDTGALDRYYLQSEYNAMYELLSQYYAPKIREDSSAGKNLEKVRSLLSAVYGEKKSAVEQYSDFLHIINVDEATLDTSGSERTVDIS